MKFKRGQPGRAKKISSAARRQHQLRNRQERQEAEAIGGPGATPEEVAAMVDQAATVDTTNVMCPLCMHPITDDQDAKFMTWNGARVLVHESC